ncbi:MAG: methyltransferase [Alphaproteobacteria bacterium]|nr:methyltransferase [Alphaproteobacteria bacterium]
METTIDKLLDGRFALEQPKKGYRMAVDTLLLAASVPATEGQRALDLGCGVGGVMLALRTRVSGLRIDGVEIQPALAQLCASNIARNNFQGQLCVKEGDLKHPDLIEEGVFDHVVMNPPYHDDKTHLRSPDPSKALACSEGDEADLGAWIACAARALKDGGMMSLIHRYDRLDDIMVNAGAFFSTLVVKPIISKEGQTPKRVIVRGVKGKGSPSRIDAPPFILYSEQGRYSQEGESILRGAKVLEFF